MTQTSTKPDLRQIGEAAFAEVLGILLSRPVSLRNPSPDGPISGVPDPVISTVLLAGPRLSASVQLRLPVPFLAHAVHLLTGLDGAAPDASALLDDTAGELANLVAGRVAAQLAAKGYPSALGTPAVSRGAGLPVPPQPGVDHGRAELSCDGHRLALELQCCYAAP